MREQRQKLLKALVQVSALGFICLQIFRWQSFAHQATWLSFKEWTQGLSFEDHLRFGDLCSSIENYDCAVEQFQQALALHPKHLKALGNVAIARSLMNDVEAANQAFESYFKAGGLAYDVMYYFSKHLFANGETDLGLEWLYRSLSVNTFNQTIAEELLSQLLLMGKSYEALSLLGALSGGEIAAHRVWNRKFEDLHEYIEAFDLDEAQISKEHEKSPSKAMRIPSLDGINYYVPVRYDRSSRFSFFSIDRTQEYTVIPASLLATWSYEKYKSISQELSPTKGTTPVFKMDQVQVGPWMLKNVSLKMCKDCAPRLGKDILKRLNMRKGQDQIIDYVLLNPQEESL